MSTTNRFPFLRNIPNVGPAETTQIITLAAAVTSLPVGGAQAYTNVRPWLIAGENTEAPYTCIVLEFSANAVGTIGDGTTELIGLYGQIDLIANPAVAADRKRTLLAILGLGLGNQMPQIPIVQQAGPAADLVGYAQMVQNVAIYDRLSIGGVLGDVDLAEGLALTVVARPIRQRNYLG